MIREIQSPGKPLAEEDVAELERLIGRRLPDDYRAFLLANNGGMPVPDAFPIHGFPEEDEGEIQVFFGIGREVESSDLSWNVNTFKERVPPNLLPIACNSGGDLICLSVSGDDVGAGLFWDSTDERDAPGYENVYKISDTFKGFVESICDPED